MAVGRSARLLKALEGGRLKDLTGLCRNGLTPGGGGRKGGEVAGRRGRKAGYKN